MGRLNSVRFFEGYFANNTELEIRTALGEMRFDRPAGTGTLSSIDTQHQVLGYFHQVPSSFVSPSHEKQRQPRNYDGQAGTPYVDAYARQREKSGPALPIVGADRSIRTFLPYLTGKLFPVLITRICSAHSCVCSFRFGRFSWTFVTPELKRFSRWQ
jgi:hypothetical protein